MLMKEVRAGSYYLYENAQNEVEGSERLLQEEVKPRELWIVDVVPGSNHANIERLSRQFLELRLLFYPTCHLQCAQEALKLINAPALLLIDGTNLRCKDVLN